jgi:hypothetical protein
MSTPAPMMQTLIEKIRTLPAERRAEVEDFIDFLRQRDTERQLTRAAMALSTPTLEAIWDNPEDADYDRL